MNFNLQTYNRFKTEYQRAVKENKEQFTFDGHSFLTQYAKYLLQYLKPKFEKQPA